MTWHIPPDFRWGARAVAARPRFAALVMVTLALGVGVNVAIFSAGTQVLLRPLPVPEPERLVNLADPGPKRFPMAQFPFSQEPASVSGGSDTVFSYPMFRDLERAQEPFVGLAGHRFFEARLRRTSDERVRLETGALVSGSYFPLLSIAPAVGRLLDPQDDAVDGRAEAVVLSHSFWQSEFGGDPNILGNTLVINDVPLTIVGVAPRGFHGTSTGAQAKVFVPITIAFPDDALHADLQPALIPNHYSRNQYWVHLFARLKPGVTREQAAAAMDPPYRAILTDVEAPMLTRVNDQQREAFRTRTLLLEPGARGQTSSQILSPARNGLKLLFAVSGLALLLCCANVAGLMQLRAMARSGEIAVRASMGATRRRVASLLLAESLVLALPAALLSLPVAWLTLRGVRGLPNISAAAPELSLNVTAALVAAAIAVTAALAVGLLPAWGLTRAELAKTLQASAARHGASKGVARFRAALATAQVMLSMALLATTFVFAQSLSNIARLDLGVDIDSVVTFRIPPPNGLATHGASLPPLIEALEAIPGVSSVSTSMRPLFSVGPTLLIGAGVEGAEVEPLPVPANNIGADFFRTFRTEVLAGRDFDASDDVQTAIVNRRFTEHFGLAPVDAIGRQVNYGRGATTQIVGVVENVRFGKVTEIEPQFFMPATNPELTWRGSPTFYVRSTQPPADLFNAVRESVARVDSGLAIANFRTMEQQFREHIATERVFAGAAAAFSIFVTLLAGLGLYGVLAYSVAQRSPEIALRFALGAPVRRIRGMVVRQVAGMALAGVVLGAIAAWLLGRAARSLLVGVEPVDPFALAVAAAVLGAVTFVASYVPARRASRTDPATAMRYE